MKVGAFLWRGYNQAFWTGRFRLGKAEITLWMEGLSQHRYKWKLRLVAIFIHKTCSSQTVKTLESSQRKRSRRVFSWECLSPENFFFKKSPSNLFIKREINIMYIIEFPFCLPQGSNIVIFLCHDFTLPTYYPFFECWIYRSCLWKYSCCTVLLKL